jgi:hypothetical protein
MDTMPIFGLCSYSISAMSPRRNDDLTPLIH